MVQKLEFEWLTNNERVNNLTNIKEFLHALSRGILFIFCLAGNLIINAKTTTVSTVTVPATTSTLTYSVPMNAGDTIFLINTSIGTTPHIREYTTPTHSVNLFQNEIRLWNSYFIESNDVFTAYTINSGSGTYTITIVINSPMISMKFMKKNFLNNVSSGSFYITNSTILPLEKPNYATLSRGNYTLNPSTPSPTITNSGFYNMDYNSNLNYNDTIIVNKGFLESTDTVRLGYYTSDPTISTFTLTPFTPTVFDADNSTFNDNNSVKLLKGASTSTIIVNGLSLQQVGLYTSSGLKWVFTRRDNITTNISSLKNSKDYIEIHPNPFSDFITIKEDDVKIDKIMITDALGSIIFQEENFGDKSNSVNLSSLPIGIYFVQLKYKNEIITKKIIKQ